MKKSEQKPNPMFNYNECSKYIENKLGYPLRDTLGTFKGNSVEYRDYWHYLIDCHNHITNGCCFQITSDMLEDGKDWQNEITQAFIDEFGETSYWVEW